MRFVPPPHKIWKTPPARCEATCGALCPPFSQDMERPARCSLQLTSSLAADVWVVWWAAGWSVCGVPSVASWLVD